METQAVRKQLARRIWWMDHSPWIVSVAFVGVILMMLLVSPVYTAWDARSAPVISARGTVLSCAGNYVMVRLGKTSVSFEHNSPFRPGDPVQVFYQVGRSGRIYVASANRIR